MESARNIQHIIIRMDMNKSSEPSCEIDEMTIPDVWQKETKLFS